MTDINILRGEQMKVGDTEPELRMKVLDDGNPYNLDNLGVGIRIKRTDADTPHVNTSATVENAGRGIVTYSWSDGDTDEPGTYLLELTATDGSSTQITFPNDQPARIYITEQL